MAVAVALLHCGAPEAETNPPDTAQPDTAQPDTAQPDAASPTGAESPGPAAAGSPPVAPADAPSAATPSTRVPEQPVTPTLERPGSGAPEATEPGGSGSSETPPVVASPPPVARCTSASTLVAGDQSLSLEHDGVERSYLVHVPRDLDPASPAALVVDMHGLTSSATQQAALSGWRRKADQEGFIVAHPQGLDASWNGGDLCCGTSQSEGVDDEGFIRAMVARLERDACIDPQRVYATGLSNGGAMSHLLACNAADVFAASAPVSMGNGTRPCAPSRPISVVMTRGTADPLVSFDGGLFPSAKQDFEQWAELDGCQGEPERVDELCEVYAHCAGGVEVKLCAIDAGHVLYDNDQGFSVPDVVWETFLRQRLP
jgi:polyhydroxybutyrate depolymerase